MNRRSKIVATLGPACDHGDVLEQMIAQGVDVVRLNFSHGEAGDHRLRAERVRELAAAQGRHVAILGDLQGPKIRVARFQNGSETLIVGQKFCIDPTLEKEGGSNSAVGSDYPELAKDCRPGDQLLVDDGRIVLSVSEIVGSALHCDVVIGGVISNHKGINKLGGGLSAEALTEKDKRDIKLAAEIDVDFLAVSFPRSANDMHYARQLAQQAGCKADLVAKIERAETVADVEQLDSLINASDVLMVARGDLGVEIGDAELVGVQKQIIRRARLQNKPVITATQMMESMISSPLPTRAEVFDVANAVLDGTDAVMLSAETAAGDFPVETVAAMVRIIKGAESQSTEGENSENQRSSCNANHRLNETFTDIDESIALSAMYVANHLSGIKAIICMTESGTTPRLMSRIGSQLPIYAFARREDTRQKVCLYKGVQAIAFSTDQLPPQQINQRAVELLLQRGDLAKGDLVIISKGDYVDVHGGTNTMKILRAGDTIR